MKRFIVGCYYPYENYGIDEFDTREEAEAEHAENVRLGYTSFVAEVFTFHEGSNS